MTHVQNACVCAVALVSCSTEHWAGDAWASLPEVKELSDDMESGVLVASHCLRIVATISPSVRQRSHKPGQPQLRVRNPLGSRTLQSRRFMQSMKELAAVTVVER